MNGRPKLSLPVEVTQEQPIGQVLVNEKLIILTSNETFNRWSNDTHSGVVGQSLLEVFPELVGLKEGLQQLIHQHDQAKILTVPKIHRPSSNSPGRYFNLQIEAVPTFGSVLLVMVTDVSEQIRLATQVERTLQESEERFRQVVLSISDHIYVVEVVAGGRYSNPYLSPHVELLTGYPRERFMVDWEFWSSIIHPDDRVIAQEQATRLAGGKNSEAEYRLIRADGNIIWVRDSGQVQTKGAARVIYGVVSDITIRKQMQETQQANAKQLEIA